MPVVDPAAERRAAEADAAAKANEALISDARRKRAQKGLLAADGDGTTVLQSAGAVPNQTVLGSGGSGA